MVWLLIFVVDLAWVWVGSRQELRCRMGCCCSAAWQALRCRKA
jgi:hypothetical protein